MTFRITADTRKVRTALERKFPDAYARESAVALEEIADDVIATIKRRRIWTGGKGGETLKEGLWRGDVESRRSGAKIDTGWSGKGAAFGPSHEFGYKKNRWPVKPTNVRTSTKQTSKRIGKPIKALRFVVGGRVVYSRGHMVSKPRSEKPHFMPAYRKVDTAGIMGDALDRAIKRAGLSESEASRARVRITRVRSHGSGQ